MLRRYPLEVGFTLIELMIVIAIIGILASIAVPQYGQYTKRAKFSEVISRTAAYKSAVQLCIQDLNKLAGCSSAQKRIPAAITTPSGYVQSLTVTDGLITATATSFLEQRQYILDPSYNATTNSLSWSVSGSCLSAGLCSD